MRSRLLELACIAVVAAGGCVLPADALAAGTSHVTNWETHDDSVDCGIADVHGTKLDPGTGTALNGNWPGLQCSAAGIPRAPGSSVGDPFIQLGQGQAGRARVVDLSQDDLIFNKNPVALAGGTTWSRNGITCTVTVSSINCHNSSGHGFTLRTGHDTTH